MHFDAQTARAHMPKGLVALMDQAQGAINTEANADATEGVARRTFLKAAAASGFALGAYPLVASAQGSQGAGAAPAGLKPFEQPSAFVRIEGVVEKVSDEESDEYFHSRPLDSRIGAWASPQSQVIAGRSVLVANAAKYGAQFMLKPPRPPHWGGYRLKPDQWEFWQGRKSRLHDRLRYRLDGTDWVRERLAP